MCVGSVRMGGRRYHPQQSVLKPQFGQRHTACIRYMSAPHRSHSVFSAVGVAEALTGEIVMTGRGGAWSGIARLWHARRPDLGRAS